MGHIHGIIVCHKIQFFYLIRLVHACLHAKLFASCLLHKGLYHIRKLPSVLQRKLKNIPFIGRNAQIAPICFPEKTAYRSASQLLRESAKLSFSLAVTARCR